MHTPRTSAGEAILPDPSLEKDTPRDSRPQTVLLSKLQKRLNGNYDSLISCPFVVIVYKYPQDTLCAFERAIDYTQGLQKMISHIYPQLDIDKVDPSHKKLQIEKNPSTLRCLTSKVSPHDSLRAAQTIK